MSKSFYIFLLLLFFTQELCAQNIEPKRGFEQLYIGMSEDSLIQLLGSPSEIYNYEEEKNSWIKSGYNPDTKVIFHMGFDAVFVFGQNNDFGLWRAYIKNGKVNYLTITSYRANPNAKLNITIDNKLSFGSSFKEVTEHFGDKFYTNKDAHNSTEIIYFDLGLRFIFMNKNLHHVYVFKLLPKSLERLILDNF